MRRIAQERDEDDEILRDGQSLRVRMTMIDQAMHRAIDEVYPRTIKDAAHRPGFRPLNTLQQVDAKRRAYLDYDRRVADEYRSPFGGNATTIPTPVSAVRVRGVRRFGDPCTKDGWPGVIKQAPDGSLYCEVTPVHPRNADAKKKQLRDPQGREAGSEEFGRDEDENENTEQHDHDVGSVNGMRDGIKQLAHEAGLVSDQDGDWDDDFWNKFVDYARKVMMGEEEDAGDRDREAMIERITRAATTHTETPHHRVSMA